MKYKINDDVIVTNKYCSQHNKKGIIIAVDIDYGYDWVVSFGSYGCRYFNESELELVTPAPLRKLTEEDIDSGCIKLCDFDIKSIKNTGIFLFITYTDGDIKPLCMELEIEVK